MPVRPPPRWTARSLTVMFMPHLFRRPRNFAEAIGPIKEKVPLDADLNHMFIKRKEEKMKKAIRKSYALNLNPPKGTPKRQLWSVTTGEWVSHSFLKLDTFFPFALGPLVAQEVSRRIDFRDFYNGLLLPTSVWAAFNNWKLTIAPQESHRYEMTPKGYQFRILDQGPENLKPVYPESTLTVGDLDRQPLHFRTNTVPNPHSCYFQSCCAVWRLTYLEQPDRSAEEFWERFQYKMDGLWGTLEDRKRVLLIFKPPELLTSEDVEARAAGADSPARDEPATFEEVLEGLSVQTKATSRKATSRKATSRKAPFRTVRRIRS